MKIGDVWKVGKIHIWITPSDDPIVTFLDGIWALAVYEWFDLFELFQKKAFLGGK